MQVSLLLNFFDKGSLSKVNHFTIRHFKNRNPLKKVKKYFYRKIRSRQAFRYLRISTRYKRSLALVCMNKASYLLKIKIHILTRETKETK